MKPSTGLALIEHDKVNYITSNATDIKDLITNIGTLVDQIVVALSGIDALTTSPGTNAASIALVSTLKATLVAQKELLK